MKTVATILIGCTILLSACAGVAPASESAPAAAEDGSGALTLVANGEDFVRQGFVSKDGWSIQFEHLYVTLADVMAYQSPEPYDAATGEAVEGASVGSAGPTTLDLAEGDENADPIVVEAVADAPAGQYNAMSWRMTPATEGDAAGATVMLVGSAEKEGTVVNFTIRDATEYAYTCGEFVGDERKGILSADGEANVEATFHFDHVFGDADAPADDALNVGALGFDPLAALAQDGQLETSVSELEAQLSAEDYAKLTGTLATLGHVGEGHCYEATGGYTGHGSGE